MSPTPLQRSSTPGSPTLAAQRYEAPDLRSGLSPLAQARYSVTHPSPERIAALQANLDTAQDALHVERARNRSLTAENEALRRRIAELEDGGPAVTVAPDVTDEDPMFN